MQIRKHNLRFIFIFFGLLLCLVVFAVKLVFIQIFHSPHLTKLANKQHSYFLKIDPVRGTIYDRNAHPLAFNVSVYSLFANPRRMSSEYKKRAIEELPKLLSLDSSFIKKRLDRKKYFVWIKRKLSVELTQEIRKLKIRGLEFRKESKRYYPNGSLAAHIIGFAGTDNEGLEGLELAYNQDLRGKAGGARILRDARRRELMLQRGFVAPRHGHHIVLTIDETIQYITERALDKAYEKHKAKAASVIVMDPTTGEILALANRPTYDLSNVSTSNLENRTNRAISYMYEPGSVFKIVTASAALEEEAFIEEDEIFCENGEYRVSRHVLHDHRPHGILTFREVFELSSNIGVTKIAQKIGLSTIQKYIHRFQFGKKTGIDLRGEAPGMVNAPSSWSGTSIGAIPIGHEVAVTPLQLVCATSIIANKGVAMKPFVVKGIKDTNDQSIKSFSPMVVGRAISEDTARRVTSILQGVVDRGTGRRAQIEGIGVAGKTGTAQKVIKGKHSHSKFYATFMGFAPTDNPRLAIVVVFDEPHPDYFGGTVSAPVFKEIMENALRYLEGTREGK